MTEREGLGGHLDQSKVEAFAGRIFEMLNVSARAMFVSMGQKTGLFAVMSRLPPSTSRQIAEAAGLDERYVREWLGGMVVGRVVDYDPSGGTYALPPEHALVLNARDATRMAGHVQHLPHLFAAEPAILKCFREGGGLPWAEHPASGCVPVGEADSDATLLQRITASAPGLVDRLKDGIDAADFGCGNGHTLNVMARAFPRSRFTAYDLLPDLIATGRDEAEKLGLSNARFVVQDMTALDLRDAYDLIMVFDVVHDAAKPRALLKVISAALRPGATFFMADVRASSLLEKNLDHPLAPYHFLWSITWCMTGSLAAGGEGLGSMWGEEKTLEYLSDAGFRDVAIHRPPDDYINNFYICTKQR